MFCCLFMYIWSRSYFGSSFLIMENNHGRVVATYLLGLIASLASTIGDVGLESQIQLLRTNPRAAAHAASQAAPTAAWGPPRQANAAGVPVGAVPCPGGGYRVPRGHALGCTSLCEDCEAPCGRPLTLNKPFHNHHVCQRCGNTWNENA